MTAQNGSTVQFGKVLETGMKLKKVMLKKGLERARAKCPFCDGMLWGKLNKNRGALHLHMKCDGTCGTVMME